MPLPMSFKLLALVSLVCQTVLGSHPNTISAAPQTRTLRSIPTNLHRQIRGVRSRLARRREVLRPNVEIPNDVVEHVSNTVQHISNVASEPVVLPCHRMKCISSSVPQGTGGLKNYGLALLSALTLYLTSTPGVLAGVLDMYLLAPLQRLFEPNFRYSLDDLAIGKMIAEGGFGEVYRATLIGRKETRDVIVKRAKEFGRPEVWMNERMKRSAPNVIAEYITAFSEEQDDSSGSSPILLVWNNEGEYTLSNLMAKQDFPYNAGEILFGKEGQQQETDSPAEPKEAQKTRWSFRRSTSKRPSTSKSMERSDRNQLRIYRKLMEQMLTALKACHATGIVHRDVKPQNFILSAGDKRVKLIDLGAAADLRIGINYVPNEFLLDPRYAPPQQYIMSSRTPRAPPAPIAVFLSPVLWQMNYPDRFDIYSAGMSMLQMIFAPLRSDNALIVFNRRMRKEFGYDLERWRAVENRREYDDGFRLLDADNGAGWELLKMLLSYDPKNRPSASEALAHRFFGSLSPLGAVNVFASQVEKGLDSIINSDILLDYIGGRARGLDKIFTEVELKEEFAEEFSGRPDDMTDTNTIRWWEGRSKALGKNKMDATETQIMYKEEVLAELKKKVKKPPRRQI